MKYSTPGTNDIDKKKINKNLSVNDLNHLSYNSLPSFSAYKKTVK